MSITVMKQALEALENLQGLCSEESGFVEQVTIWTPDAIYALHTAIAEAEKQEAAERYIHEYRSKPHPGDFGIPRGHWWQAKQYADVLYTTPPTAQPAQRKPSYKEFMEWAAKEGYDTAYAINPNTGKFIAHSPMTADLWKAWQAAHDIKENT